MRIIELNHGKVAFVDDWHYERLSKFKYRAQYARGKWYARRGERVGNKVKNIAMSHDIVRMDKRKVTIKYLNGNTLDCREKNLYDPTLIGKKIRYKYGHRKSEAMKTALIRILERIAIDVEYGLHTTYWEDKSDYNTVLIPEPLMNVSFKENTCTCGQIFYAETIPNHHCNHQQKLAS